MRFLVFPVICVAKLFLHVSCPGFIPEDKNWHVTCDNQIRLRIGLQNLYVDLLVMAITAIEEPVQARVSMSISRSISGQKEGRNEPQF